LSCSSSVIGAKLGFAAYAVISSWIPAFWVASATPRRSASSPGSGLVWPGDQAVVMSSPSKLAFSANSTFCSARVWSEYFTPSSSAPIVSVLP